MAHLPGGFDAVNRPGDPGKNAANLFVGIGVGITLIVMLIPIVEIKQVSTKIRPLSAVC